MKMNKLPLRRKLVFKSIKKYVPDFIEKSPMR